MPKSLLSFCLFCTLCLGVQTVLAKELIIGQKPYRFSLDIADIWQEEMLANGLLLTNHDHSKSLIISVVDGEGLALNSLDSYRLPSRLELKDVKKKEQKDCVTFSGTRDGVPLLVQLHRRHRIFVSVLATGLEKKQVDDLLTSLTPVADEEEGKEAKEEEKSKKDNAVGR